MSKNKKCEMQRRLIKATRVDWIVVINELDRY